MGQNVNKTMIWARNTAMEEFVIDREITSILGILSLILNI